MEIAGSPTLGKELHSAAIAAAASANLRRGLTGRVSFISRRSGGCFADDGHLRYYGSPVRCGARKEEKMMMKRREKLVEGLVGLRAAGGLNLNALAGCEVDDGQVAVDKVADALLARLGMLRAEEKEMKKRMKKEKKLAMKASSELMEIADNSSSSSSSEDDDGQMKMKTMSCKKSKSDEKNDEMNMKTPSCKDSKSEDSSSSSSSESSDSECEMPLKMKDLRSVPVDVLPLDKPQSEKVSSTTAVSTKIEAQCNAAVSIPDKRIEVCMGGKCKKSGAMELMQQFQQEIRSVGAEEVVVGCKCLGKCKQAPSVRVMNSNAAEAGESPTPLFLGVGIQDVGAIIANFFPENKDLGLASA